MLATLEETDKHVVRLAIEIPPDEFQRDLDRAYRKVAGEVKIPGFRKGKVPKRIIDARVGRDVVLEEFVHEFVPSYYLRAVRQHELAPIGDPDIDIEAADVEPGQPLRFTATVEVRPRIVLEPERYLGISVVAPASEPSEREIDQFLDRFRERFAELESVARPARAGDYVLADVRATVHDREIPEATRIGYMAEVGSEELVPELDRELEGKRKGDILKFNAILPEKLGSQVAGQEVTFQVLVKEVKGKKLPEADDEFARLASEFDTLDELRQDIRTKLRAAKESESRAAVRDQVLQGVTEMVDVDIPDRLVDEETMQRVARAARRAEQAGTTLEDVLEQQGWDELRFRSDARSHALRAIKADLALEAVARQEGISVDAEDLQRETRALAEVSGRDAREVRRILERTGQVTSLAGDIIRSKALDLLVEAANVAAEGSPAPSSTGADAHHDGEKDSDE